MAMLPLTSCCGCGCGGLRAALDLLRHCAVLRSQPQQQRNEAVLREASQDFVRVSSQVIEDHKSLLWLVGTGSSALAGWCVYVLRRVHYERIEGAMSEISLKMKDMEKRADHEKSDVRSISKIEMVTIIAPAVVSAFSFGYLAGRAVSSYQWHKQLRLQTGLTQKKVYVAVIPAPQFEAKTLARELERAIGQNTETLDTRRLRVSGRDVGSAMDQISTDVDRVTPQELPSFAADLGFGSKRAADASGKDSKYVATLEHVKVNLKKEQMMEDRYTEIDRDNRILLKKMTEIMKQQTTFPPAERKSGPTSLNRDARKKELMRITRENQSILKRIQQAQPVYNHVEWEDQHRRNVTYLRNKCEFPVVLRTPRRGGASSELINMGEEDGAMTSRSAPSTSRAPPKDLADGANQKYVLKEGMKLSDTYYLVDMSTDGRNLFISAYDNTSSTTLELIIKEKLHRQLYRETNGDYRRIADRLKVAEDGKLLLDGEEAVDELDAAAMVRSKGSLSAR
ncbi:unnamed protein product [Cladocopium goreaui]|uniref:Uncharacterized protein n=1 Tax=Cladocopium goreaui TaxID=2562237 RepID=A0A9P1M5Y2_9DINO|nr:unnamed protein product [Cladocopium goreaui]